MSLSRIRIKEIIASEAFLRYTYTITCIGQSQKLRFTSKNVSFICMPVVDVVLQDRISCAMKHNDNITVLEWLSPPSLPGDLFGLFSSKCSWVPHDEKTCSGIHHCWLPDSSAPSRGATSAQWWQRLIRLAVLDWCRRLLVWDIVSNCSMGINSFMEIMLVIIFMHIILITNSFKCAWSRWRADLWSGEASIRSGPRQQRCLHCWLETSKEPPVPVCDPPLTSTLMRYFSWSWFSRIVLVLSHLLARLPAARWFWMNLCWWVCSYAGEFCPSQDFHRTWGWSKGVY